MTERKKANKPRHGGPAKGEGHGGPAKGAGWGGAAKGASASRIKPGDPDGIQAFGNQPDTRARTAERRAKVLAMYEAFVDDIEQAPAIRISAGDKLLDRLEGKPMQAMVAFGADREKLDAAKLDDASLSDAVRSELAAFLAGQNSGNDDAAG